MILVNYLGTKTQCCLCHHNLIKYGFYGGGFLGIFLTWSLFLSFRTGARSLSIILPLLGITWIFGFLAFNSDTIAFEYIFAVANSLQVPINSALFICCCYCCCFVTIKMLKPRFNITSGFFLTTCLVLFSGIPVDIIPLYLKQRGKISCFWMLSILSQIYSS